MTTTPTSAPDPYVAPIVAPRTTPLAILAIIAAFLVPLAGIIIGHLALAQTKRTGEPGRRLALVATVIGYVLTAAIVIVLVLVAVVPLFLHTETPTYSKF